MKARFLIFGGWVSIGLHAVVLTLFALCSGDHDHRQVPEPADTVSESPAQTNDVRSAVESPSTEERPAEAPSAPVGEYRVQAGDTLVAIARRVGCSVSELAEANGSDVKKLSRLRIGQRLILPDGARRP